MSLLVQLLVPIVMVKSLIFGRTELMATEAHMRKRLGIWKPIRMTIAFGCNVSTILSA